MGARPARIQKARVEGNTSYLKAAGRRGGMKAAENRRVAGRFDEADALFDERRNEVAESDELQRKQQAGEDILPPALYE